MPNMVPENVPRIVGRKPTPRVLLITGEDSLAEELEPLFPTCERVSSPWARREAEYDLVVSTESVAESSSFGGFRSVSKGLFQITFGVRDLGPVIHSDDKEGWLSFSGWTNAKEYVIPAHDNPAMRRLVDNDLLPAVQSRQEDHHSIVMGANFKPNSKTGITPLLMTTDDHVLAAVFARPGGSLGLGLPKEVKDRVGWVKAALQMFRLVAPERFQRIPGWEELPEWLTAKEARLRGQLDELEAERERVLHDMGLRDRALRSEIAAASARAEAGVRRLLTSQHGDLPEAVAEALEGLGFVVKLMDPEHDPHNKLEDLRVSDLQADDWEALVEVRGYKGGASLGDLLRTQRFAANYERATGHPPAAVWYIVNQFAGADPGERQRVLAGQQADLEEWADMQAGTAMDTTSLFRLIVDVEAGRRSADEARALLRESAVRFVYPIS